MLRLSADADDDSEQLEVRPGADIGIIQPKKLKNIRIDLLISVPKGLRSDKDIATEAELCYMTIKLLNEHCKALKLELAKKCNKSIHSFSDIKKILSPLEEKEIDEQLPQLNIIAGAGKGSNLPSKRIMTEKEIKIGVEDFKDTPTIENLALHLTKTFETIALEDEKKYLAEFKTAIADLETEPDFILKYKILRWDEACSELKEYKDNYKKAKERYETDLAFKQEINTICNAYFLRGNKLNTYLGDFKPKAIKINPSLEKIDFKQLSQKEGVDYVLREVAYLKSLKNTLLLYSMQKIDTAFVSTFREQAHEIQCRALNFRTQNYTKVKETQPLIVYGDPHPRKIVTKTLQTPTQPPKTSSPIPIPKRTRPLTAHRKSSLQNPLPKGTPKLPKSLSSSPSSSSPEEEMNINDSHNSSPGSNYFRDLLLEGDKKEELAPPIIPTSPSIPMYKGSGAKFFSKNRDSRPSSSASTVTSTPPPSPTSSIFSSPGSPRASISPPKGSSALFLDGFLDPCRPKITRSQSAPDLLTPINTARRK